MDFLPSDPAILVSSINMLLRDGEYDSLDTLCSAFGRDKDEILRLLDDNGYVYSVDQRQVRPKGFDE